MKVAAALVLIGALAVACGDDDSPSPTVPVSASVSTTIAIGLVVAPEADASDYDRDLFGAYDRQAALDASLARRGCYYSQADDVCYTDPGEVDVDHIVPLREAWQSGITSTDSYLEPFGGDPANLWLMTDNLNQSKSDQDIAEWVPPSPAALCVYVDRWVTVKSAYQLTADPAEQAVLERLVADC